MIKLRIITKKAQSSLEFMVVLALILVVFIFFLAVFEKRKDEFASKPDEFAAKTLAENVALSVNKVYILGSNSSSTVFIPEVLYHTSNFSITIYGNSRIVDIKYRLKHYSYPILTSNINTILLPKGHIINITNSGGDIYVTY
jgi:uncharacterized protein (UPF0333 family)